MAVIWNKLVQDDSVAFVQSGGLWNGLLSCGRSAEPPHSQALCGVSSLRSSAGVNPFETVNSSGRKGGRDPARSAADEEARTVFHRSITVSMNPLLFFQQRTSTSLVISIPSLQQ